MRHAFWVIVIGFSVSALAGGFLSGRAAVPHFAPVAARTVPSPAPLGDIVPRALSEMDVTAEDRFASDSAVTVDSVNGDLRDDSRLAVVLLDGGHSVPLESPFLGLGIPVAVVIDPSGAAAKQMARLSRERGDAFFVQAHAPLTASQIASARTAYPGVSGMAIRITGAGDVSRHAVNALRAGGLTLLDEYGESEARGQLAATGVRFAARSITVDDHIQRTYVQYMLRQAVHLGRAGTAVVMARPFPGTLQAFEDILARASRDGVRFVGLP